MRALVLSLLTLAAATAFAETTTPTLDYRFDEVRRKVLLATPTQPTQQVQAARGQKAQSGDKVNTGWFSYALIASDAHRAKFEIFSGTEVELAGGTPGVILSLHRGKLHAMFDKITGSEPRVVQTPGALLAVRGTQYVVEVDGQGETKLDVLEGIVEIRSPLRPEPFLVRAGEAASFGRKRPPVAAPPRERGRGPNGVKPQGEGGGDPRHPGGQRPEGGDAHGNPPTPQPDGHGGHPPQGNPPPRPMPGPPPSPPPSGKP